MTKVFISYARDGSHGQNLAAEVHEKLQAAGFEVFRDVIGLKPGDVWYSKLEFELETSDVMVLVVSEKVRRSKWVHNEVSMAEEIGIPVIPVLAEKIRSPLWLRHLQTLDFCEVMNWAVLVEVVGFKHSCPNLSPTEVSIETVLSQGEGLKNNDTVSPSPDVGRGGRVAPFWASNSGQDQYGQYADLTIKNVTQRFRWIQPGTFQMGSPDSEEGRISERETRHQVTLTKGYWLADTACTQSFWQAITRNNPAHFNDGLNCPVERVSWDDVQQFVQALNQQQSGLKARLPSEAEWEYACRAGTETAYSFGEVINSELANCANNVGKTAVVKSFSPNAWGLYQMHGNVWEWCQDAWQEKFPAAPVTDPLLAGKAGSYRVIRGGSWYDSPRFVRSACRNWSTPDYRYYSIGFRLAQGH